MARDEVLDHSDVMTALRGYSAPIPMPITNRHCVELDVSWLSVDASSGGEPTDPGEQSQERHFAIAIATCGDSYGRDDDKHELNTVEPSSSIAVSQIPKEYLATNRAEEGEEVYDEAGPSLVGEVDECD